MSENRENKEKTACFSGYRPHKFNFPLQGDENDKFVTSVYKEISNAVESGFDTFITGMAPGFDIIAGELVIMAKRSYPDKHITLIAALPYSNFKNSKHFDDYWHKRYDSLLEYCTFVVNTTKNANHTKGCYDIRNKFMVDSSSLLICYSTGKSGGSENTIAYAKKQGVRIENIADTTI